MDYISFTSQYRNYRVKILEEEFKKLPTEKHRKYFALAVFEEEYKAYEDLGYFIKAFYKYAKNNKEKPLKTIFKSKPKSVELERLFNDLNITSGNELYSLLSLDSYCDSITHDEFPNIDFDLVLRKASGYFFSECRKNQTQEGIKAYNKIKHGLIVIPNSSLYSKAVNDHPGVLIENQTKNGLEPLVYSVISDDSNLNIRLDTIEFIQNNLKLINALYLIKEYSSFLFSSGFNSPFDIFKQVYFKNEMGFYEQVTNMKSKSKA